MKGGRRTTWKGDGGQHGASRSTRCLPKASSSWDKPARVPCPSLSTKTLPSSPAPSRGPYPCPLISILSRRTLSMSSPHLHPLQEDPTHAPLSPAPPRGLSPCPLISVLPRRTLPMSPHLHPPKEDPIHVISSSPSSPGGPYPCHLLISILSRNTLPMSPCPQPLQEDSTHVPSIPSPSGRTPGVPRPQLINQACCARSTTLRV